MAQYGQGAGAQGDYQKYMSGYQQYMQGQGGNEGCKKQAHFLSRKTEEAWRFNQSLHDTVETS